MDFFRSTAALNKIASPQILNKLIKAISADETTNAIELIDKLGQLDDFSDLEQQLKTQGINAQVVAEFIKGIAVFIPQWSDVENSPLLKPITEISKEQKWPLVNIEPKNVGASTGILAWAFNYQLEAGLSLTYYAKAPQKLADKLPDDISLLSYSLDGKMALGTSLELSLAKSALAFSAGGAINGSAAGQIELYFQHAPETVLLDAIRSDFKELNVLDNFSAFKNDQMQALTIDLSGDVKLSANMKLGYQWDMGHHINGDTSNKAVAVELGIGAEASWLLSGEMAVLCYQVENENSIMLELQRSKTQTTEKALTIGATITAPGIQQQAKDYLVELNKYDQRIQEFLDTYAEPKSWLTEKIDQQFEQHNDWVKAIVGLASGQTDEATLKKQLSDKIAEELAGPFAEFNGWIDAQDQQNLIATKIAEVLGQDIGSNAEDYLFKLINATTKQYQEDITTKVTSWLAKPADKYILAPLKAFGLNVDEILDNSEAAVQKVLQPLYKFKAHYQSRLKTLTDFINNTMIEELGVSFKASDKLSNTDESLLKIKFKFDHLDDSIELKQVEKLYQQCLLGDFSELLSMYRDSNDYSSLFSLENCTFKTAQSRENEFNLSINLFGLTSNSATIMSADAIIEYNGKGQLSIFESKSVYQKMKVSGNEGKSIKVSNNVNLLAGSKSTFDMVVNYDDADLTSKESNGFWQLFELLGMTAKGTSAKVIQTLTEQKLINVSKDHPLTLRSALSLTPNQISIACNKTEDEIESIALEQQCLAWIKYTELHPKTTYQTHLYIIQSYDKSKNIHDNVKSLGPLSSTAMSRKIKKVVEREYSGAASRWIDRQVKGTVRRIKSINHNADILPVYLDALAALRAHPVPTTIDNELAQSSKELLNDAAQELNTVLASWIKSFATIFQINMDRVHPTTAAFINVMRLLADAKDEQIVPMVYESVPGQLPKPIIVL